MKRALPHIAAASVLALSSSAHADGSDAGTHPVSADPASPWAFTLTAYPTAVRGAENYSSAIAIAEHGALHLEARYNYESIGARSAFIGWSFSGGDALTWKLTPLIGGAWGSTQAFVPGLEASVAWKGFDFYLEAELVRDNTTSTGSYIFGWSELGYRPVDWLRAGLAGQRTRAYGGDRDFQRGPFFQVNWGRATLGAYWFNPGSAEQIIVGMLGVAF